MPDPVLPNVVFAQASPRSVNTSLFNLTPITASTVERAMAKQDVMLNAAGELHSRGFTILQQSPTTINIAGPPDLYERAFGCRLEARDEMVLKSQNRRDNATFVRCAATEDSGFIETSGGPFDFVVEGIAIEEPRYLFESAIGPKGKYWHLNVPGDVSVGLNADRVHRSGFTGAGVKVAMVDTGHYPHPFFAERGYAVSRVLGPGADGLQTDEVGHGTAESANIFAVAPGADLTMVKMHLANTTGAFNTAVQQAPQIITCSWGGDIRSRQLRPADRALAAAVASAVLRGIIVVFSAGNGHFGFPGQHPDVISAGGTYMERDGTLRASDYSSGFASQVYRERRVPDVTGLVGMLPRGAYIMLPVPPRSMIDGDLAGNAAHPHGDETAADDGWAAISGTSAAAPQVAGVCALLKQVNPRLSPAEVRDILRSTARDVTQGNCSPNDGMGHAAGVGPDLATGHGLVDAYAATLGAHNELFMSIRSGVVQREEPEPWPRTCACCSSARRGMR